MTYFETVDWMFAQLPMYQRSGKTAFTGKLDNTLVFSAHLNHPEKKFKSIHVGGTNGKGSCSHMLASILQEAGFTVGLYTSPHLKDFRERIKINGRPVSKQFVIDFIADNNAFFQEFKLSFFEMTVGMAFAYFAERKVDIAIIEVGLGGRLDSTNIIVPEVVLITNIGLDHVDMLGDTIEKIAVEKAGIIKENVPVVISEYQEETAPTFQGIAEQRNAKIIFADKTVQKTYDTALLGAYQTKNTKGVIAVLRGLSNFKVAEKHIGKGLRNVVKNTGLQGRWQILQDSPMVVCDTAHNREGLSLVLQQVSHQKFNNLHLVLGFVKEKDLDAILPLFPKNAQYYFCSPNVPRGLDAEILWRKADVLGLKGKMFASVSMAYRAALDQADKTDFIFIGGSTFTVAEVI